MIIGQCFIKFSLQSFIKLFLLFQTFFFFKQLMWVMGYFMKTSHTAAIIRINAKRWFHCSAWCWNKMLARITNTVRLIHSCITFNCISEKGPPLSIQPIRFAGTWQQYSKKAIPHEKAMMPMSGHDFVTPLCCKERCPYQASVIKILLRIRSKMVYNPFI